MFRFKKNINSEDERRVVSNQRRVVSYYTASAKQIDAFERSRQAKQKDKSVIRNKFIVFSLVILIIVLLYSLIAVPGSARVIVKGGGPYRSNEEYSDITNKVIDSSWKNKLKPMIDKKTLESEIKKEIPEANIVDMNIPILGQSPLIIIETAPPFAILNQTGNPSFVVTDRGKAAIDITKTVINNEKLSSIRNDSGIVINAGDQLFKPLEMEAIKEIVFQYNSTGQNQVPLIIPLQPREIHVQNGNYVVRFSLDTGPTTSVQFGAMKAIQQEIDRGLQAPPTKYIDVRLGDKAFIL